MHAREREKERKKGQTGHHAILRNVVGVARFVGILLLVTEKQNKAYDVGHKILTHTHTCSLAWLVKHFQLARLLEFYKKLQQ